MARRFSNTFNPNTGFGQGLQNIARAFFNAQPDPNQQAQQDLINAQTEQARVAARVNQAKIDQQARENLARDRIAGAFQQDQMLREQGGDFGAEDVAGQAFTAGLPTATARSAIQGGLDPRQVSPLIFSGLSQNLGEDQLRRLLPGIGQTPNLNTAITTERADELQRQKAIAAGRGPDQLAEVFLGFDEQSGLPIVERQPPAAGQRVLPSAGFLPRTPTPQRPLKVDPQLADRFGFLLDDLGGESLSPQDRLNVIGSASSSFQNPESPEFGNAPAAISTAFQQFAPAGLETVEDPGITGVPFTGDFGIPLVPGFMDPFQASEEVTAPVEPAPAQPQQPQSGFSSLPDPSQFNGKVIRDTETGKRFKSNGNQWLEIS